MVVYWDAVLLFNGICDYLLLLCTVRLAGRTVRRKRLLFAALIGALYGLSVSVMAWSLFFAPFVLAIMGKIAFCKSGETRKLTLLFGLLSCFFAGLLMLLARFASFSYGNLPWHIFIMAFGVSYVVLGILLRSGLQKTGKSLMTATFFHHGRQVKLRLLCDSGNLLCDEKGERIPIVEEKALSALHIAPEECGTITCRTVGENAALQTFVCERVCMNRVTRNHCKVAMTPREIGGIYAGLWYDEDLENNTGAAL